MAQHAIPEAGPVLMTCGNNPALDQLSAYCRAPCTMPENSYTTRSLAMAPRGLPKKWKKRGSNCLGADENNQKKPKMRWRFAVSYDGVTGRCRIG